MTLTRAMTEQQLLDAIVEAAKLYGWMVAHFRPALTAKGWRTPMQGDPGFPDLVLARQDRTPLLIEVKSAKGRLSDAQQDWWRALGAMYRIVYPHELDRVLEWLK